MWRSSDTTQQLFRQWAAFRGTRLLVARVSPCFSRIEFLACHFHPCAAVANLTGNRLCSRHGFGEPIIRHKSQFAFPADTVEKSHRTHGRRFPSRSRFIEVPIRAANAERIPMSIPLSPGPSDTFKDCNNPAPDDAFRGRGLYCRTLSSVPGSRIKGHQFPVTGMQCEAKS